MKTAKTWEGTPYTPRYILKILVPGSGKYAGSNPVKDEGADCSGATWKIYEEAGFSYGSYQSTATFRTLVGADNDKEMKGKHFKQVSTPQVGDIGWWNGHMAIYDLNAGKTDKGLDGNVWSVSNPKSTRPFGPGLIKWYDNDYKAPAKWYRYWKAGTPK